MRLTRQASWCCSTQVAQPVLERYGIETRFAHRIMALLMYSLAEMHIREAPAQSGRYIWDQKNQPTSKPTIRWIFMIFEDVLLPYQRTGQTVHRRAMNIEEEHRIVLECLGPHYEKI